MELSEKTRKEIERLVTLNDIVNVDDERIGSCVADRFSEMYSNEQEYIEFNEEIAKIVLEVTEDGSTYDSAKPGPELKITYLEKEQIPQDETTLYWFSVGNDDYYAVCENAENDPCIVDYEGYPVDQRIERQLKDLLIVTEEMRADF